MDLTYEETMRRIEEEERTDILGRKCCREKRMPYHIHVYQGENQMLIVPLITAASGLSVEMARYWQIYDLKNEHIIGNAIFEALAYIKSRPVDARNAKERKEDAVMRRASKCKDYKSFYKKYLYAILTYQEDGTYLVSPDGHNETNYVYDRREHRVHLPANITAETIGKVLIEQFAQMEAFYQSLKKQPPSRPRITFDTLSGDKLSFETLPEESYEEEEDYGTAEIYQGYSYYKESADESVADIYFSIAAELDCDISSDNIRKTYGKLYGADAEIRITDVTHPVFEKRIEVTGKKIHHITYVKQVDENELLACELELKVKPAGKRIYAKVLNDFEKLVESSKIE